MIRTGNVKNNERIFQVNKFLGIGAVVIMIAAMGYVILAMMTRMFKPAIKRSNEQAPKQLASKEKNSQTTSSKAKDKETQDRTSKQLPDVKTDDWQLVLVGPDHKLEKEIDESTQLASLSNGYLIDKRIAPEYEAFAKAAEEAGFPLVMVSAYRSVSSQQQVFEQNVQDVMSRKVYQKRRRQKSLKKRLRSRIQRTPHRSGSRCRRSKLVQQLSFYCIGCKLRRSAWS